MKKWEQFKGFLDNGDWHVHTDYVDCENSVLEMCERAEKNRLRLIAFTEHVRMEMDYDFNALLRDVEEARKRFPGLKILIGCEAKVLANGEIDVSEDVLKICDIVIASFHGFPPEKKKQTGALEKMLKNPDVDIWGHPGTLLNNCNMSKKEMESVIRLCIKNKVLIERSLKYGAPEEFINLVERLGAETVTGSDAHSLRDIRKIDHNQLPLLYSK
jgi:putative hydrolase